VHYSELIIELNQHKNYLMPKCSVIRLMKADLNLHFIMIIDKKRRKETWANIS